VVLPEFADEGHHEVVSALPVLYPGDELGPDFDVGLAADEQAFELREEQVEVLDNKRAVELVGFQGLAFL